MDTATPTTRYTDTIDQIALVARTVLILGSTISDHDCAFARETLAMTETMGPIADPTKYRAAMADGRLDFQRDLLEAFVSYRTRIRQLMAKYPGAAIGPLQDA